MKRLFDFFFRRTAVIEVGKHQWCQVIYDTKDTFQDYRFRKDESHSYPNCLIYIRDYVLYEHTNVSTGSKKLELKYLN